MEPKRDNQACQKEMKQKHIMLISNSFGSLYNFRYELILELLKKYQVTLVTPMEEADYVHFTPFKEQGCRLIETSMKRRGKNPFKDFVLFQNYQKLLKQQKPDLVMTYTIKPNVYGGMAAAKLKIPYFANITGLGTAFEKDGILKKISTILYRRGLKKCNLVFFQNKASKLIMEELHILQGEGKLVPGSGINLDKFPVCEYPEEESYLYMARIMKEKGAEEFFYAMEKMKKNFPGVKFDVVGFCEEAYEERLMEYKNNGVLNYFGWRDDPETFLKSTSCLINPSYHEGMSNVCLEAAATGRPMIVSDIPGCQETVDDKKTGYVFSVANREALYQKMEQFHNLSYEEKRTMGLEGRKKMEAEFDRKKVVEMYLQEIQRIIS